MSVQILDILSEIFDNFSVSQVIFWESTLKYKYSYVQRKSAKS
jgi:hypothetical protein